MGRKRQILDLFVFMNGLRVGKLSQLSTGNLQFSYELSWLGRKEARPISLSLPLSERKYDGLVVRHFFDNLLPDNSDIRSRLQQRFSTPTNECFDLLSSIGRDCIGAIQLLTDPTPPAINKIEGKILSDHDIATRLKNYRSAPLGMTDDSEFRISLAGAQEKTAFTWHRKRWRDPKGSTPTTHIFKLPIGRIEHAQIDLSQSVENEWLCLAILRKFSLPVNNAEITAFEKSTVLVVERFDRRWSTDHKTILRLPQEDMCQALGVSPNLKYESNGGPGIIDIMDLLAASSQPQADREQFMTTVFLFWLLGAVDGHAKNFSIFLMAGGGFRLTPIYDVISVYPLTSNRQLDYQKAKLAMSIRGKNKHYRLVEIQRRHWTQLAKLCRFNPKTMDDIICRVMDEIHNVIDQVKSELPNEFPDAIAASIFSGIKQAAKKINF